MSSGLFLFNVLVIVGSFQGVVTSLLLWLLPDKNVSKRILAGLLLVFVLLSFKILLHTLHLWDTSLRYFPLAFELAIQPFIYLYVRSLTQPTSKFTSREFIHFVPAALFMGHALIVFGSVVGVPDLSQKDIIAETWHFNLVKRIEDYLAILSSGGYLYAGYQEIRQYRQWLYDNVASTDYPEYTWLRNILVLTTILCGGLTLNMLLDFGFGFGQLYFIHWEILFVYMSALIYYVGFKGYRQVSPPAPLSKPASGTRLLPEQPVDHAVEQAIIKALEQEKIYLDPEINLTALARHIGVNASLLSATINQAFGKNFRNLINTYRVEEVKRKMTDPACAHLSLLGIALECGFNSEASFYRIFRQITGKSPKDYASSPTQ